MSTNDITVTHQSSQQTWTIDSHSLFKSSSIIESFFKHESAEQKTKTLIIDDDNISAEAIEMFLAFINYPNNVMDSYGSFLHLSSILNVPLVAPLVSRYQTQSLIRLMQDCISFSVNLLDEKNNDAKTLMIDNIVALDTMIDADWNSNVIKLLTKEGFPAQDRDDFSSPPSPPAHRYAPKSLSNRTASARRRKRETVTLQSSLRQKLSHATLARCCNVFFGGTPELITPDNNVSPSLTTTLPVDIASTSSRISRAMQDDTNNRIEPTTLFPYLNERDNFTGGTRPWADYRSSDYEDDHIFG